MLGIDVFLKRACTVELLATVLAGMPDAPVNGQQVFLQAASLGCLIITLRAGISQPFMERGPVFVPGALVFEILVTNLALVSEFSVLRIVVVFCCGD